MNLKAILSKFTKSSGRGQLCIAVQPNAIYLSPDANSENSAPLEFPIEGHWEQALKLALTSGNYSGYSAVVTFNPKHYQIYQIDKPEIPQSEWPSALPFLLKDLISERVSDIVADAFLLPESRKIQAYVFNKRLLFTLTEVLNQAGVRLNRVLPEEEVWGHVQSDIQNFMLLHRGIGSDFKIGAYIENRNRFQRSIRGVVAPLTDNASSELQFDSLALELQRSIDYLSSQIRSASINHLLVCCDEEAVDQLQQALSERLSVKVVSVSENRDEHCGHILIKSMPLLPSAGINLYQEHLKPKKELLNLTNVMAGWALVIIAMLGAYGYLRYQAGQAEQQVADIKSENSVLTQELQQLQSKLISHKPSLEKMAAIERIKADIEAKKATLTAVGQFDDSLMQGYSGVMQSLSRLANSDISLSDIRLTQDQLSLKGLARTPDSVPAWVKQFKTELNLIGRSFDKLTMDRTEDNLVTFELATSVTGESATTEGGQ